MRPLRLRRQLVRFGALVCQIVASASFNASIASSTMRSIAISGQSYVLFDNVKGRFGGAVLEGAMTTGIFEARILGVNEMVKLPLNVTWLATANDAVYTGDMIRRTCPIMLSTDVEHPEARSEFKYPRLLDHVKCRRSELLIAAMSIVSNFIEAGCPDQRLLSWGGFEHWSDLIRGAIVWVGLTDPMGALEVLKSSATEDTAGLTIKLIDAWTFDTAMTVKLALTLMASEPEKYTALADLIDGRPDKDRTAAEYLGKLLRGARGQVVQGRCIQKDSSDKHRPKWFIEIKSSAAA
jgi:putative DNA primase/helicase